MLKVKNVPRGVLSICIADLHEISGFFYSKLWKVNGTHTRKLALKKVINVLIRASVRVFETTCKDKFQNKKQKASRERKKVSPQQTVLT